MIGDFGCEDFLQCHLRIFDTPYVSQRNWRALGEHGIPWDGSNDGLESGTAYGIRRIQERDGIKNEDVEEHDGEMTQAAVRRIRDERGLTITVEQPYINDTRSRKFNMHKYT